MEISDLPGQIGVNNSNAPMANDNQTSASPLSIIKKKPNSSQNIYNNPPIFRNKSCFVCAKTPLIGIYFTCNDCAASTKMTDYYNICKANSRIINTSSIFLF